MQLGNIIYSVLRINIYLKMMILQNIQIIHEKKNNKSVNKTVQPWTECCIIICLKCLVKQSNTKQYNVHENCEKIYKIQIFFPITFLIQGHLYSKLVILYQHLPSLYAPCNYSV